MKAIAHLTYIIHSDDPASDKPENEQHQIKAQAALDHAIGLSRLLNFINVDPTDQAPEDIERLADGLHAVSDVLGIILDAAYGSIDQMTETV